MVAAAVTLIMKKGMSWDPGVGSPENTAHISPPRNGPRARTPLAKLCAVPFTAPLFDGGANLFTIACDRTTKCQRYYVCHPIDSASFEGVQVCSIFSAPAASSYSLGCSAYAPFLTSCATMM